MNFSNALTLIKQGDCLRRAGWNGKGMFIFLVPGSRFAVSRPPLLDIFQDGAEVRYQPHIDMVTADGSVVPWLASQSDLLTDDWEVAGGV